VRKFIFEPFAASPLRLRVVLITLYVLINGIVLYNAQVHYVHIGYDMNGHMDYAKALARGVLPTRDDSYEFFSPPLPYAPAALALAAGMEADAAFKLAQYVQAGCSIVLTFFLLKLCLLAGSHPALRIFALLCLGVIPAYYKAFAMFRGEPMLATAAVVLAWLAVEVFACEKRSPGWAIALGLAMGAAILSRQWGFFLLPAVGVLAVLGGRQPDVRPEMLRVLAIAALVLLVSGGWFYASLYHRHGTIRAFNRPTVVVSKLPRSFYYRPNLRAAMTAPVRGNLPNSLWPILYSDIWGDYWMNFVVYGRWDSKRYVQGGRIQKGSVQKHLTESNLAEMIPYLARVNRVSLMPSAIMLFGLGMGVGTVLRLARLGSVSSSQAVIAFATTAVIATLAGYLWFLVHYADDSDDTVKGVYVLQIFPFLALLGAMVLDRVRQRYPRTGVVLAVLLAGVWVHNLPAMLTHYPDRGDVRDESRPGATAPTL
jgi:hypothetical protein